MTERVVPVRTCIGCRERAAKSDLLRVVADGTLVVPDLRGGRPGRGAHLHPTPECLALAERRRAFGRALRQVGPLDASPVRDYLAGQHHEDQNTSPSKGGRQR